MRTSRAYAAAFGTSGSLLAVAALAFVFASAFVSFRGFPQVASAGRPSSVTVPPPPRTAASPTARRLVAVLRRAAPAPARSRPRGGRSRSGVRARPGAGGAPGSGAGSRAGGSHGAVGSPAVAHAPVAAAGGGAAGPNSVPSRRRASGFSGAAAAGPVGQAIKQTTGAGQKLVSGARSTAGQIGSTVQRTVASGPPPAGSAGGAAPKAATPSITP